MARRIKIADNKHSKFRELIDHDYYGIFDQIKDIFMISAGIGYSKKKSEPIKKAKSERSIRYSVFGDTDKASIDAVALSETDDLHILLNKKEQLDKKFTIVEEFANSGIDELKERLMDSKGNPIDNLAEFILEQEGFSEQLDDGEQVLEKLSKDLFD